MDGMSKSPEKIKKDLAAWGTGVRIDIGCGEFVPPTPEYMLNGVRSADVCRDALALIQQLEAQNAELVRKTEQLERERDALAKDVSGYCPTRAFIEGLEWRGVQEKEENNG